ncbi:GH32 C-terminal domain-containing protein [Flavobacterium aestuarii]|uniref:GH32 C-terminal domain-containing protein n=1 Tax=Flavobacterium aestuarii TaxID=3149227 RepID=UPI0032B3F186
MKKYIIVFLACLAILSCKTKKDPAPDIPDPTPVPNSATEILSFKFNENSGQSLEEGKTKSSFTINGPLNSAERISGIEGNALRVNGYYGWATGNVKVTYPTSQVCITGWVAPAAFPVQRKDLDPITENTIAAIFSNVNTTNSSGAALGINHHGRVIGQFKAGTNVIQILSDKEIELKKWNFLALNINASQGKASMFHNGVLIKEITFAAGTLAWDNNATVYIGKESKSKTVAGFDTNGLTGAIDRVSVWNKNLTSTEILAQFSAITPSEPNLKIPAERFANDIHRPKYHLMPSAAWSNETHGLIYIDNKYHIFSQRNFNGPYLEHINWGHYVSDDLVSWNEKTQVLWPQPGFDEVGIWSGHAVVKNGEPFIFYTGVNKSRAGIGLATSAAPYDVWKKNGNPIIANAPTSFANADFRDPFVFQNNSEWYMMIGTGLRNGTPRGGLFLYKSTGGDFTQWSLQGTMLEGNPSVDGTGEFWEMPVYYNFGSKSIVLINKLPNANALYWSGNFNGSQFIKDNAVPERLDVINQLLSPSIGQDASGNLTAIGIIPDGVSSAKQKAQGWAHVFSLPRVWTLVNGKIKQVPHPNLLKLRGGVTNFSNVNFSQSTTNVLNGASGSQYEIVASIDPGTATKVGFSLNKNTGTGEQTLIYYDYSANSFVVDRSKSSILSGVPLSNQSTNYVLPAGNVNWRIFVDASVIEVFVNNELAFATRSFPSTGNNLIDLYAQGGTAKAVDLKIYNVSGGGVASASKISKDKKETMHPTVYPNPSNADFNIRFNKNEDAVVYAYVFDTNGYPLKKIESVLNSENQVIKWDGRMENGEKAAEGVYIIKGFYNEELFDTKLIVN